MFISAPPIIGTAVRSATRIQLTSDNKTSGQPSADNIRCGRLLPGTVWYKRSASRLARRHRSALLQLRILQLGLFKDGDVRVRVFPELKKLQVGVACLGLVSSQHVGAATLEPRQSTQRGIHCDATVVQELLELRSRFRALMQRQIRLAANIRRIKRAANLELRSRCSQFVLRRGS